MNKEIRNRWIFFKKEKEGERKESRVRGKKDVLSFLCSQNIIKTFVTSKDVATSPHWQVSNSAGKTN